MATIRNLLINAREDAGLTQRQLAADADVPQASVSRIERGLISPRAATVERWLAACGRTLHTRSLPSDQGSAVAEPVAVSEVPDVTGTAETEDVAPDWAPWMSG